jgi:antitoxin component YwqK of YwqJK toxin-antitoxin module
MKYKLLLVISCFSIFGCGETIDARQLEIDNGLFYKKGDSDPFNGTAENFYPGYGKGVTFSKIAPKNIAQCTAEFKDGELHGSLECFSNDDERIAIIELKEGKKHGKETIWDSPSGNLLYDVEFDNNSKNGYELTYDKTGENLLIEQNFSEGKIKSSKKWNSAGELTEKMTYSNKGATGFHVNNGGTASYYLADKGIVVQKEWEFKSGYKPEWEWSTEGKYYGDMEGTYIRVIVVGPPSGHNNTYDYFDENGNLKGGDIPQYKSKKGLSESFINGLTPDSFD